MAKKKPVVKIDKDDTFFCLHSDLCKTLAQPKRQKILYALHEREMTVSELAMATGIFQANLSQHLAILRSKGVLNTRRNGKFISYKVANPKIIKAFDLITEAMEEILKTQTQAVTSPGDARRR